MKFESITGKASIYVYQDFYAQILVYNMIHDIRRNADYNAEMCGYQKKMEYQIHTNENIAIGLFKHHFTDFKKTYNKKWHNNHFCCIVRLRTKKHRRSDYYAKLTIP